MRRALRLAPLLALAAAPACTCERPPAPVITAVTPGRAPADADTTLSVSGAHFEPRVQADLDDPERSGVSAEFALTLVSGTARVALAGPALVSGGEIRAVLPAGAAAPGAWGLELVDPRGARAFLPDALVVFSPQCPTDGASCDDGDACTAADVCRSGACVGTEPVACAAADACHVAGTCDPATGACSAPAAPDGTPCDDGIACTGPDACLAGVCQPGPATCGNTAPLARLVVVPASASAPSPAFAFDASGSSDLEDAPARLSFRFDFDSDGVWDTAFSSSPTATLAGYPTPGVHTATVEVRDSGGLSAFASALAVSVDPASQVVVTTGADEGDAGATPAAPGGAGLSLREAIAYVNGLSTGAAATITFAEPFRIALAKGPLPALRADGAAIVGRPGLVVDCTALDQTCLQLQGSHQQVLAMAFEGGGAPVLQLSGSDSWVAQCRIAGDAGPLSTGVLASQSGTIGPRNDVSGANVGVNVSSDDVVVDGNRIHDNSAQGILVSNGEEFAIERNLVFGNGGAGIQLNVATGVVRSNTVDRNQIGVAQVAQASADVRDNLFTNNVRYGLGGPAAGYGPLDHNGFFGNGSGAVEGGAPGSSDLVADPGYLDPAAGDYRLAPGSPAVDAGIDLGLDLNGNAAGSWNGNAPDLGAQESPYSRP